MADRYLCHYTMLSYTDAYWAEAVSMRKNFHTALLKDLSLSIPRFDFYQVFPARADADLLLWTNQPLEQPGDPVRFLDCLAKVLNTYRQWVRPNLTLWGFTRPSAYARGQSAQAIHPMDETRKPFLVVYPFVKTVEWYRTGRDTRQGMMNEHIRIGHQYEQITQLLLYSTGLQDQEFVVVYETDDLAQFSDLVAELRSSEARRFTERDTPIFTAFYHSPAETLELFG